ncbi:MAG: TaqI-like C-terminal specificity domain-containing protein [Pseudomonadota bacterium]|nr:TaqI-like C-terminal specificity domain-containing protein [Pseudomonadota bacterium]
MAQQQLSEQSWQLEDEKLAALRSKLSAGHQTLKQSYGSPLYGIKTGLNAAFVIDRATHDRLIDQDAGSVELLKPFLEGKDLKKWHAQPRDLWLIYTPKNKNNIDDYPAIKDWLLPFKERLNKRATKQEWFELQQAQFAYYEAFTTRKIYYPDITDSSKFHLDKSGAFSGNTGYFLPSEDMFLLGLLNTSVVWFVLTGLADAVRGGFYRMFSQNINRVPIPVATDQQKETIANLAQQIQSLAEQRYQIENSFRRRLPDLCPPERESKLKKKLHSWWLLDFPQLQAALKTAFKTTIPLTERNDWQDYFEAEQHKINTLNQQIRELEQQLDQAIYALFDLSADEIDLLQKNV